MLIADDHPVNQKLVRWILEAAGMEGVRANLEKLGMSKYARAFEDNGFDSCERGALAPAARRSCR